MEKRTLELVWMLRGVRYRIELVRREVSLDHDPIVTARIWKAERMIQQAEDLVHEGIGRNNRLK